MTSTRYVLTPDPGTLMDDYIQAAIAAITAISGRPLDSLDAIPERLRYLFREEGLSKAEVPAAHFKLALSADAVKADDLGWIDTFKPAAPADDEATIEAINAIDPMIQRFRLAGMIYHSIRRGKVPGLPSPDEHAALKAEVERLKADISAQSNLANAAGKVIDELKSEIDELRNFCDKGVASNDRLLQVVDQRDALNNEVERLRAEIVALRASSEEF